jgi:hypothetical protein
MSTHPSFFALDALALGSEDAALREHLAHCEVCEAHVRKVTAGASYPVGFVPARKPYTWFYGLVAAASLAALTVVVLDQDSIRAKGVPGVAVYVKRGEDVFLWKQADPLRAGDRIRLTVEGHGLGYVRVVSEQGSVLYEGELTQDKAALPLSWRIEGNSEQERFVVLLSQSKNSEPVERIPVAIDVRGTP